ncbi:hypothetical protein N7448_008989 [Penicillium atrosanguineum]|nr:hypothetical protein N7448_008989 [Penicillium atrosanguineum]
MPEILPDLRGLKLAKLWGKGLGLVDPQYQARAEAHPQGSASLGPPTGFGIARNKLGPIALLQGGITTKTGGCVDPAGRAILRIR